MGPTVKAKPPIFGVRGDAASAHLPVEGAFPSWLKGSLVANGPAVFESGKWKAKHASDGLARVQRLDVQGGDISYLARLLDTQALSDALGAGESSRPGFATPARRSFWGKVRDSFVPPVADNANASVVPTKHGLLALGETSAPVEVDRARLSACGPRPFPEADLEAVHPVLEPDGALLGISTRLREPAGHVLWRTGADGRSRRVLARLPSAFPSYVHSFSVTAKHAILVEPPLVLDPSGPKKRPLRERMAWQPARGTKFVVLGRADGRVRATGHGAPFFVLHHVQAFERGAEVLVDLVAHEDAGVLDAISAGTAASGASELAGRVWRCRIPPSGGFVETQRMSDEPIEFPTVNATRPGHAARHVYGLGSDPKRSHGSLDQIVKIDLENEGKAVRWRRAGAWPGPPSFVPRPGARKDDDGVVLSLVFDGDRGESSLVALDAATLKEIAHAQLPEPSPVPSHACWVSG